jgi:hypothetical protein
MKVRLFFEDSLPQKFHESINEFVTGNKVEVIDIKFSTVKLDNVIRLYALVMYEEAK